jgi:hypothetical protein
MKHYKKDSEYQFTAEEKALQQAIFSLAVLIALGAISVFGALLYIFS